MASVAAGFLLHKSAIFPNSSLDMVIAWCLFLTWLACELYTYMDNSSKDPLRSVNNVYDLVQFVQLGIDQHKDHNCTDARLTEYLIEQILEEKNKSRDSLMSY